MPTQFDPFIVDDRVYPTIFDKLHVDDEIGSISVNTIVGNTYIKPERIPNARIDQPVKIEEGKGIGLTMADYGRIDDKYINACIVVSYLLTKEVFFDLGVKVHIKSQNGMKEKILYREKHVNDMLRVTVYCEERNLLSMKSSVIDKLSRINLISHEESETQNKKPKFIYSFQFFWEGENFPMWLEIQFSSFTNESQIPLAKTAIKITTHADYELKRLMRGPTNPETMRETFKNYSDHVCCEDKDLRDVNIVRLILNEEVLFINHEHGVNL